ncbi:hypothetical protein LCGC14_0857930 [marine sediment metagenome]|uniref:Isoprenoid biosynthesis protein n=1 Tax=marine sediment metagenome TaxID=412755 RepID=A0A0F9PD38_9ZZZZ|nr:DUF3108 domain-containing protein [Methylophaga sp.]HEC59026.1 DUF3108 domain-containing protein [Methylophaga sp.]
MFRAIVLCLLLMPLSLAAKEIPDFSANYLVMLNGIQAGDLKQRLSTNANGTREFNSSTQAQGIFAFFKPDVIEEISTWTMLNNKIQPHHYIYQRSGGKKEKYLELNFDWQSNQLSINDKNHPWQLELEPDTLDKLIYQLALMNDLDKNKKQYNYRIADGGKIKTYTIMLLGEETVMTPLGRIKTVKLKRLRDEESKRQTVLWCAPALNYLPVRLEHTEKDGTVFTASLRRLRGISTDKAFIQSGGDAKAGFN